MDNERKKKKKKRKVRFSPPARLTWGGGGKVDASRKPARESTLWVDKYAPKNTDELCVASKKVEEVRCWMETRSASEKMLILIGSPGVGKSTLVRLLAKELDWTIHEWSDSYSNKSDPLGPMSVGQISPLRSFEEFLQRTGAGFRSLLGSQSRASKAKSIILLDELPNLYSSEAETNFRDLMNHHLESSNVPTIMIFSDVSEGKHKPADLERLIDKKYLYSNLVVIFGIQAATKAKMKKACSLICKKENVQLPDWEEFNLHCNGDIRHAIMTLQFRGKEKASSLQEIRDKKLSTFHALGKILYSKRQKVNHGNNGERPPLECNPETVMEESDMGLGGALTFLGYHSPDFFTDITELSQAFGHFSDAASLMDLKIDAQTRQADHIFPDGYVASLSGRAIADANKHPAPTTFRALSAPKVFEVYRKSRANESTMLQLCKRLSVGSGELSLDTNIGASRTFIIDHLPYMREIFPNDINLALGTLYSFVGPDTAGDRSREQDLEAKLLDEQAAILAEDDIVDDDDDDDNSMNEVTLPAAAVIKVTQSEGDEVRKSFSANSPSEIIVIDD